MDFSYDLLADHSRRIPFDPYGLSYIRTAASPCRAGGLSCVASFYLRCAVFTEVLQKAKTVVFFYSDSCFLPLPRSWRCISSARICAGLVRSVSQRSWRQSEGSNRMRCSLHGCPCGTQSTCCSLTGHIFFAASPSLHSAFWAYTPCKRKQQMRDTTICEQAPSETPKISNEVIHALKNRNSLNT